MDFVTTYKHHMQMQYNAGNLKAYLDFKEVYDNFFV